MLVSIYTKHRLLNSNNLVGPPGLEPGTKGFRFVWLSPLPGLCLHHILDKNLDGCRLVSTPSKCFHTELGSALAYQSFDLAFSEFDTIPHAVSTHAAQLSL